MNKRRSVLLISTELNSSVGALYIGWALLLLIALAVYGGPERGRGTGEFCRDSLGTFRLDNGSLDQAYNQFGETEARIGSHRLSDVNQKRRASTDGVWRSLGEPGERRHHFTANAKGGLSRSFELNDALLKKLLRTAPFECVKTKPQLIMSLPLPDGSFSRFRIEESPIMERTLGAHFPSIRTYRGKGVDNAAATARFTISPKGFHAIILSVPGTVFITPGQGKRSNIYLSFDQQAQEGAGSLLCSVAETDKSELIERLSLTNPLAHAESNGSTLRTYRLAVAATGEYTQTYGGGTVEGALAAITTTINMVNAIFERDLAIRLNLVSNEANVIFTNPTTDGYSGDNITAIQNQNQNILDARIGVNNYDIGHVFDGHSSASPGRFFFQGRADVATVCINGRKAAGASVFRALPPDHINAVYVVAHEMGHQFGASHSFNGTTTSDCLNGRVPSTAFEPGTGSTIMGYRGTSGSNAGYFPVCGAEDLRSTDLYFHVASIAQITNYTTNSSGANCANVIDLGNNPPEVDAGPDYTIPRGTPFTLAATGSDADSDSLTYCWEEFDLGSPSPPSTDDGARPIFRSFAPVPTPVRIFPQLSDILSGTSTFGESLPVTTRSMSFRVTVRDNRSGGGAVSTDAMLLSVTASSGPFVVPQPASTWAAGNTETVFWNVAGTADAPVNCAKVRILLSIDGGSTFPLVLASETANNGSATITVPNAATSTARIKVEALGNVFFDISPANFAIAASRPVLLTEQQDQTRAVALDSVTFLRDPFAVATVHNFSADQRRRIALFVMNLQLPDGNPPAGLVVQGEDAQHRVLQMPVEFTGKVPGFNWLTQIVVRLPDGFPAGSDVGVTVSFGASVSNSALVRIQ